MLVVWLLVSEDEYELPLAVADSRNELAKIVGVKPKDISECISKYHKRKNHHRPCRYVRVEIEEGEL